MNQSDSEFVRNRREKMQKLLEEGIDPYPPRAPQYVPTNSILADFDSLCTTESEHTLMGRLMALRLHGKTAFADLHDEHGRIQIYLKKDLLGETKFDLTKLLDLGDFVWVKGTAFRTHTREATLKVSDLGILTKALRPMPIVKVTEDESGNQIRHDAISDPEIKYRQRYLDLMTDPDARKRFAARSHIVSYLRRTLDDQGFLEVETPALQPIYGGANARPFITHHHTLNMRLYLRIADELFLKRLLVGGFEKVYEISKDFRNEGVDRTHYPEFTQLELYKAGSDYLGMMALCETLVSEACLMLHNTMKITYQGKDLDFTTPWRRLPIDEAIKTYAQLPSGLASSHEEMLACCKKHNLPVTDGMPWEKLVNELIEACVEPELWQPTFLCDYPRELSPLAKRKPEDERLAERFEPFVAGIEIGNAFTEQNDPDEQRRLMEAQMERKAKGDPEAQVLDEDFLCALEYGMPPTGGMGIGIDRLVMLLTDSRAIRDVILFPQLADDKGERIRLAIEELEELTQRYFGRKPSDAEKHYYVPMLSGSVAGVSHEEATDHLRETILDSTEALEHLRLELVKTYSEILGREPQEKELLSELPELRNFGHDRIISILKGKPEYQAAHPPMRAITISRPLSAVVPTSCQRSEVLRIKIDVAGQTTGNAFLAVSLYQGKEKPHFYPDTKTFISETGSLNGEFNMKDYMMEIHMDKHQSAGEYQILVGLWLDPYGLPDTARTLAVSRLSKITLR